MAQLIFTYPDFFISSTWTGTDDPPAKVIYSEPSTKTANPVFSLTGLPAEAVIDSAILTSALGSPNTGSNIRQVDGVNFSGSMDVTVKIRGLNGVYGAGVSFEYKFQANGGSGGVGPHSASLGFSSNTLTITYHMPADTGTLDKVDLTAGGIIRLQGITQAGGYTHKARWSMGGQEIAHDLAAGVTQDEITVPMAWLTTIPNAMAGAAQVILETYSGSTLMGSVTYTFTVRVPATVKPTVSLAVAPYSDTNPAVPSAWGMYVKGRSKARLTATAAGAYGSTIKAYEFTAPGQSNPYTTPLLSTVGQVTYACKVTDSRGQTQTSAPVTITVTDYNTPTISMVTIARCLSDKTLSDFGTYIRVSATLGYTSLGGNNAIVKRRVYYRQAGDATWLPAEGIDLVNLTPDVAIGDGGISTELTYQVKIDLADSLTPANNPVPYNGYIGSNILHDFRTDRAALGRRALGPKLLVFPDDWGMRYQGQIIGVPSHDNLLLNGNLKNPVNQLAFSSSAATGFSIDGWYLYNSGTGALTLTAGGLTLTATGGTNRLQQKLEFPAQYGGKTLTLSIKLAAAVTGGALAIFANDGTDHTIASNTNINANTGDVISITGTIPAGQSSSWLMVRVWMLSGTMQIEGIKLEEGSIVTPGYSRDFDEELRRCQRQYENSWYPYNTSNVDCHLAQFWATNNADIRVDFQVPKRVVPIVNIVPETGQTGIYYYATNSTYYTAANSLILTRGIAKGVLIRFVKSASDTSAWVIGQCIQARFHWEADARIY